MSRLRGCRRWGVTVRPRTISGPATVFPFTVADGIFPCGRLRPNSFAITSRGLNGVPSPAIPFRSICAFCARYITRRSREDLYLRPPRSSMCIQVSRRPGNGRSMKGPWCGYSNSISQAAHRSVLHVIFSCSVFIAGEWPLSIWPICVNPMSTAAY